MATKKAARRATAGETVKTEAFQSADAFAGAARDQFDTMLSAFNEQAETFRGQTEEVLDQVRGNFEAAQTRLQATNAELMNAARAEMSEAVDFANELARAKTVADALEIQRGYWTNLFETRVERARELTNATVDAARESFEPFSKSMASFSASSPFAKVFPFTK